MKSFCLELLICVTIFCKFHTIKICLYYVIVISILEENWQIAALCFFLPQCLFRCKSVAILTHKKV